MATDREQEASLARLKELRLRRLQGEISPEDFERERAAALGAGAGADATSRPAEPPAAPPPATLATAHAEGAAPPTRPRPGSEPATVRRAPAPIRADPLETPAPRLSAWWLALLAAACAAVFAAVVLTPGAREREAATAVSPPPQPDPMPKYDPPPPARPRLPAKPPPLAAAPPAPAPAPAPEPAPAEPATRSAQELAGEWIVNPRDGTRIMVRVTGATSFEARYSTPVECPECLFRGEIDFTRSPPTLRVEHLLGDGSRFGTYELVLRAPELVEGRLHFATGSSGKVRWRRP